MLSIAAADTLALVHRAGEVQLYDQSWCGEVYDRACLHALVRKGLLVHAGRVPDGNGSHMQRWALTNAGRAAYATDGQMCRRDSERCGNPVCCRTWAEDPGRPPTHGSCPRCGRWVRLTKAERTARHNMVCGVVCPGVGRLREGHAGAWDELVDEALAMNAARDAG